MNKYDFLWRLIHSLSKLEVENFYRIASLADSGAPKLYELLFKTMREQSVYDEAALLKIFPAKSFPELKHRLKRHIIRSLLIYRDTPEAGMLNDCGEIEVLVEKGFQEEANFRLKPIKLQAEKEENFLILFQVLDFENALLIQDTSKRNLDKELDRIFQEREQVSEKHQNLLAYINLYNQYYTKIKSGFSPEGKFEGGVVQSLRKEPLLKSIQRAKSNRAKVYYLWLRYIVEYLSGDLAKSMRTSQELIKMYGKYPHLEREFQKDYHNRVFQQAWGSIIEGQTRKGLGIIKVFEKERKRTATPFFFWYITHFEASIRNNKPQDALKLVPEVEKGMKKFDSSLSTEWKYLLILAVTNIFFEEKEFQKAFSWIKRIVNFPNRKVRIDLQASARIINIILQYELRDFDLLEHYANGTADYLRRHDRWHGFEQRMVGFLRFLLKEEDRVEVLREFINLKTEIEEMLHENPMERSLSPIDFLQWVKDNINRLQYGIQHQ